MKIAYSVNGEGFGHAARLVSLVPRLRRWHEVEVFAPATVRDYISLRVPDLNQTEIPGFSFSKRRDRILYARTMWRNILLLQRSIRTVFRLARRLKREGFDGVVSDFEPLLAWAGRAAGLRVLQFNHPGILLKFPRLHHHYLAGSLVSLLMEGPWTHRIHCSFFRGDIGPILRQDLLDQEPTDGDYIVVNLKDGYRDTVIQNLERVARSFPGLRWKVFPDPRGGFESALAGCRAVISAAGHQMISEALVMGKPVLAIPQEGQDEQQLNARMLVRSGRGQSCRLSDFERALPKFLASLPSLEKAFLNPPPKRFTLADSSDEAVVRITKALLPRKERRQEIHHLSLEDIGLFDKGLRITVVGSGYVGLLASSGLAEWGHHCVGLDIDENKVRLLNAGSSPIYEPGLDEILARNIDEGRLRFTSDAAQALGGADVIFICVGTPQSASGEADLSAIWSVGRTIAKSLKRARRVNSRSAESAPVIVVKSTVPVGTNKRLRDLIALESGLEPGVDFELASNPEFLREGRAVEDFFSPDRTVIGTISAWARTVMSRVYATLESAGRIIEHCSPESAELSKYAANAFLACKISFINQIANLAEECGADVQTVARIMGEDPRIGPQFLKAGPGYGGSCFPKDTHALVSQARSHGVSMDMVEAAIAVNESQGLRMVEKAERLIRRMNRVPALTHLGLKRIRPRRRPEVAILGLAFKADTDDVRESPAIGLVRRLSERGMKLRLHDPKAAESFSRLFPRSRGMIEYVDTAVQALEGADLAIFVTDWQEYSQINPGRIAQLMRIPAVLDTRNIIDPESAQRAGIMLDRVGSAPLPMGNVNALSL